MVVVRAYLGAARARPFPLYPELELKRETVAQGKIDPIVQRFVADNIQSAEQLDILLLLHRSPERVWTAREVSEAVFTVPTSATMRLEELVEAGLLTTKGGADPAYEFSPSSPTLRGQVDALAEAYRDDRVGVIQLVFRKPADPLKSFSDAFRLRRDE